GDVGGNGDTRVAGLHEDAADAIAVEALDAREIWSAAGTIAASSKNSIGVSAAVNVATGGLGATVTHADVNAAALTVDSDSRRGLAALAIGAAGGGDLGVAGSLGLVVDAGTTTSTLEQSEVTLADGGPLDVSATDSSVIWNGAGALGVGGKAGAGIGA